ncbi:hypothetical protein B0T10DRAFT_260746 [Thelonectria olida]|uniref:Uncharacterized protein n=1 Tax=Thelonectria olida TaxID=1576542 RepID=A0A9P9AIG6_9HYPO|nr:hypothetical protein B0T10DRAFT_260746 [Thelonectria olida]
MKGDGIQPPYKKTSLIITSSAIAKLLESGSIHERSEAGDGCDDEGSVSATPIDEERDAGMGWEERIWTLWNREPADLSDETEKAPSVPIDPYDAYRQILKDAEASAWLVSTLNRDLALRGIVPSNMRAIRQTVLETLRYEPQRDSDGNTIHVPRQKISRHCDPQTCVAHFDLQWDPVEFLNQEFSEGEPRELISGVITVTGEGDILQALPCHDYMMQAWPFAASKFLALIQRLVTEPHKRHRVDLKGGSWLMARLEKGCLRLDTKGTYFEIAEVAEQLAWLGSALQPSCQSRHCVCEPRLSTVFHVPYEAGHELHDIQRGPSEPYFLINFLQSPLVLADTGKPDSNQCWKKLFNNMTIARGFPIPSRPSATPGLEIPLDIAADIIGEKRAVPFKARLLIKSFSTMLYPTKVDFEDGTISWHLLENDDGSRISYADPRVGNGFRDGVDRLRYKDLETAQNIIGWCSSVENVTGTTRAKYTIRTSNLDPPRQGWVLEKFQISGGKYITPSVTFARGKRIPALKFAHDNGDLIGRMEWLATKHVILHDTSDRRAWLVDGPSALLHLVRASLRADSQLYPNQKYSSVFDTLREPQERYTGRAASMEVLTDEDNLKLELRAKGGTPNQNGGDNKYRFRDRVSELLGILEQMIDHQADMKDDEGIGFHISRSPWNHLEGFDFIDVARRSDPFEPKGVFLQGEGPGWVGFTRALHAITLFGDGFGDLLCPVVTELDSCGRCYWNNSPPTGCDMLAVSMADLKYLHIDEPDWDGTEPGTRRVIQKFIWDRPASCFVPCACVPGQASPARIQTFREHSKQSKFPWAKKKPEPDAGVVRSRGGVLLGMHRHHSQKAILPTTANGPQGSFLTPEGAGRDQRTPSPSSRDGSKYAIASATSSLQASSRVSTENSWRSPSVSSMTEEDKGRGSKDIRTRTDLGLPVDNGKERAFDDIPRFGEAPRIQPSSTHATIHRHRNMKADVSYTSSPSTPDARPSISSLLRQPSNFTAAGSGTSGVKGGLRRMTGKRDLARTYKQPDDSIS